jgi:transposase InsO family protein
VVPEKPWQYISIDLIVKLPESNGYDSIAVIVDHLSKAIWVLPCTEHISAKGIARLYRNHVWKDYGLPEIVISDRGQIFVGHFMRDLLKLLGIKSNASTAYHPQTDGQTERVNREVEQYLRVFTNFMQDDWSDWLAMAEFSYNNKVHTTTDFTPFYTMLGFHPRK